MSRPNFVVKVPSIPARPKARSKKLKKKTKPHQLDCFAELDTINEAHICETRQSSYYSLNSPESSDPKLRVIETYDEFLNLKDLDKVFWKASSNVLRSDSDQSNQSIFLLKQICADLNLEVAESKSHDQVLSLFPAEHPRAPARDIQTAIIAKRIIDTQEQITNSRKNSGTGFSKESLRRSSFNRSAKSLKTIDEIPRTSSVLHQALTNLTSRYSIKHRCATSELEVQVNLMGSGKRQLNCNTQTDVNNVQDVVLSLAKHKQKSHREVQACAKQRTQQVQSSLVIYEDKHVNTTNSCFYPNQEQSTQMYEHITENDLLCMEWIDKNLFRVPLNPNTIIVDERLREASEFTCLGTNFFEQELNWEKQALCS